MFWNLLIDVLLFIYVVDCLFMLLVILMQRSKQEGLGAAFGGGITESVWGAQTSQVLVKATVWAALIFFVLSITLARLYAFRSAQATHPSALQVLDTPTAKTSVLPSTPTNSAGAAVVPTSSPMTTPAANPPVTPPASTTTPVTAPPPPKAK